MESVLVIGGSHFVGPYLVRELVSRGHRVTVFNRGQIQSTYDERVRFIRGDRNDGFPFTEHFNVVIDTSAYTGADTERALRELQFDFFVHVSTAAVYRQPASFPLREDHPLGVWPYWGEYGRGKNECEMALQRNGVSYATLRPVYILGPRNYCNRERFIYSRICHGLPIVLPGDGAAVIQFTFARDVASALVLLAERRAAGAFNCAGDEQVSLRGIVEVMAEIAGNKPLIGHRDDLEGGVASESDGFPFPNESMICDTQRLKDLGFRFTPLLAGLRDDYERYYRYVI